MFTRLRDPGLWTFDTAVEDFEFEGFDENISNALDGQDGGAYSLAADMEIGSTGPSVGWTFDLVVIFDDFTQFNEDATFSAGAAFHDPVFFTDDATFEQVTVNAFADFNGLVSFQDDVHFFAETEFEDTATFDGIVIFNDFTQYNEFATFSAGATFGDPSFFLDTVEVQGAAEFQAAVEIQGPLTFSGAGKAVQRQQLVATDGNQTLVAAQVDTFFIPDGIFSTDRQVTIDDTGAQDGMRVTLWSEDGSNFCTVRRPGGTAIGSFGGASAQLTFIERVGGVWYHRSSDGTV